MKRASFNAILLFAITALANCEILEKGWWKSSVFYEMQPRSFFDSNADGVGDLKGIASRLTHFVDSKVHAIWLTSINPSVMYFGDDVTDHKDVDRFLGTMSDLRELVKQAKQLGLHVILDIVPNHTSDLHYWFQLSVRKERKYADYYVWAIGRNNNKNPPNNWLNINGASAWTYSDVRKMWYYHQFEANQPDLNYRNPWVKREMEEVLQYWLDEGVDGFCIRDAPYIFESHKVSNDMGNNKTRIYMRSIVTNVDIERSRIFTQNQPETYKLIREWRDFLDDYADRHNSSEKVLMTEVSGNLMSIAKFYAAGSQLPINLKLITNVNGSSSASDFKRVIDDWMKAVPEEDGAPNWLMGSEKYSRLASRYHKRADQITMLGMILPGVVVTYYGDEIGMQDNMRITFNETQDLIARRAGPEMYKYISPDPHRTPYQWEDTANAGFSTANWTWLPVNKHYHSQNLARQKSMYESHYKSYQKLTNLRNMSEALKYGGLETTVLHNDVLKVVRSTANEQVTFLMNFSNMTEQRVEIHKTGTSSVFLASFGASITSQHLIDQTIIALPPTTSAIVITSVIAEESGSIAKSIATSIASTMLNNPPDYISILISILLIKL